MVLKEQRAGEWVLLLLHTGNPHKRFCLGRGIHTLSTPDGPMHARTLPGTRAPLQAQRAPRTDNTVPAQQERAHVHPLWWLRAWPPKDTKPSAPPPHFPRAAQPRTQELTPQDSSPLRAGQR